MESIAGHLYVKHDRIKPLRNRHPWIFSGAVHHIDGQPRPGDLVAVRTPEGAYLGTAYFNPESQIRARMLTWDDGPISADFWRSRLERAVAGRRALALEPATTAYRLVNAEADGLPGLIVDRYGDYVVLQCLTRGIDARRGVLVDLLAELLQPAGIIERSDVAVRAKEGLAPSSGLVYGAPPPAPLVIRENGLAFATDLLAGHKTGAYLDQRDNRRLVADPLHVAGREVLNVFAYTGGFGVYAAHNGAQRVVNVDSSAEMLHHAEANFRLNDLDPDAHDFIAADAFQLLRHYRDSDRRFDVVILDPPKFAHSRRDVDSAARGYKDLNWLALRLLRPGGLLATFSCSGLVSAELFQKIVFSAAVDAGRDVQILHPLAQGADHPVLLTFPESAYLKGLLCRVW